MRKTDAGPSNAVSETKHVLNVKSSFFDCNCNCNHRQLSFVVGRPNVSATDASAVNAIAFGCETRKRVLASPDRSRHPPTFSLYTRLKRHPAGRTKGIGLQDLHSFTSRRHRSGDIAGRHSVHAPSCCAAHHRSTYEKVIYGCHLADSSCRSR